MIDLGDSPVLSVNVLNVAGQPANVGSMQLVITLPDSTTVTIPNGTLTNTTVGTYSYPYPTTQSGHHMAVWTGTGANACSFQNSFDVEPALERLIISLDEARRALQLAGANISHDDDLRLYLTAATDVCEYYAGTLLQVIKVETFDGGGTRVLLAQRAVSVTSVIESGGTLSANADYTVNLYRGIIYRGTLQSIAFFTPGLQNVVVTYKAGVSVIPPSIRLAARMIIRHLWQLDQPGYRPAFGQPDGEVVPTDLGFGIPREAFQLLNATTPLPGFA